MMHSSNKLIRIARESISPPPFLERQDNMPCEPTGFENEEVPLPRKLPKPNAPLFVQPHMCGQLGHGRMSNAKVYRNKRDLSPGKEPKPKRNLPGNVPSANKTLDVNLFHGRHFKCIDAVQVGTAQYSENQAYRFMATIELDEAHKSIYPENILRQIFHMALNQAQIGANEKKLKPDRFILMVHASTLEYEIFANLHKLDENSAEQVLRQFQKHDQSNMAQERESVITGPFQVDVIAIESKPNPKRKRKTGHAGTARIRRRLQGYHYQVNEDALERIDNDDAYCLFRSIAWLVARETLPRQRFMEYCQDEAQKLSHVLDILDGAGIPRDKDSYDIDEHGNAVQAYLERKYPKAFKLFAFDTDKKYKPFFKSAIEDFDTPLCLFYWREEEEVGHYEPIRSMRQLFDENSRFNYCYSCELYYNTASRHRTKCKSKCLNCLRVGPEFRNGCRPQPFFAEHCENCNKNFTNAACYQYHLDKKVCEKSKKCPESGCGVIYRVDDMKRSGGHVCGHKFCRTCLGFHEKRPCFIQPFVHKKGKDKRYIIYDLECKTHFQPDPELLKFQHTVNFAWAMVFCTRCLDNGTWNKPLKEPCQLCGENRTYAWAPFEFEGTKVDVFTLTDNPLGELTDFIIHFEQNELGHADPGQNDDVERAMRIQTRQHEFETDSEDGESSEDEEVPDTITDRADAEILWRQDARERRRQKRAEEGPKQKKKKQKKFVTYVYAHAGSKYDNIFMFGELLKQKQLLPKLIRNGNRLYQMKIQRKDVTTTIFRDSIHIIPIKLAKFVPTFDLPIETKKFFPHKYNREENYDVTLDRLPEKHLYGPGAMMPKDKEEFESWYEANKNAIKFNLNNTIADYCATDVNILAHGIVKMRELFLQVTDHDITDSVTLASSCMKVFRSDLQKGHLARTPHLGYEKHGSQSVLGRKFLRWYERKHGVKVRSAESPDGELRFGQYLLDGYVERPDEEKNLLIEVHGCYWHGCKRCHPSDEQPLAGGIPAAKIRQQNEERMVTLQKEFDVQVFWQCQIEDMLEDEEEVIEYEENGKHVTVSMRSFFDNLPDTSLINLRDAFFGGRTGPECMFASTKDRKKKMVIKYKDFKSLYPSRNWHTNYPVGHPKLKEFNKHVDWRKPEDVRDNNGQRMQGIIKCFVVPPRHPNLDIPVLPMRHKDFLLFPTCRSCALTCKTGLKDPDYNCPHFEDSERGFSTTMTTLELEAALEAGYKVIELYRAYDWEMMADWDQFLFHPYMQRFMKLKYEAEDWPAACLEEGICEAVREERKQSYVDEAWRLYGIRLDADKIAYNPGMRYIAKLGMNSLWGRFALRNRLSISVVVNNHADLAEFLDNPKIDVSMIEQLDEENWLICYKTKDEHIMENESSNMVLAIWTTSSARLHLLESLYKVNDGRLDTRIIYMDTDSILYEFEEGQPDPLETGTQLGQLVDEYPNHRIIEFICSGPKAYALWLLNLITGEYEFVWRLKGLPLTADDKDQLQYDRFKQMIMAYGDEDADEEDYTEVFNIENNFRIDRRGGINTIPLRKRLRPVINKGVVLSHNTIVPFGWSSDEWCKENNPYDCVCKD